MKLIDLIKYLTNPKNLDKLLQELELNPESEALLLYMNEDLDLTAEITIFEIEETEDELIFEK
jgi:hypothetical protein